MPNSTALGSLAVMLGGTELAAKTPQGQVSVVNDHEYGATMGTPDVLVAPLTVAV
jgi:hypothetical protein